MRRARQSSARQPVEHGVEAVVQSPRRSKVIPRRSMTRDRGGVGRVGQGHDLGLPERCRTDGRAPRRRTRWPGRWPHHAGRQPVEQLGAAVVGRRQPAEPDQGPPRRSGRSPTGRSRAAAKLSVAGRRRPRRPARAGSPRRPTGSGARRGRSTARGRRRGRRGSAGAARARGPQHRRGHHSTGGVRPGRQLGGEEQQARARASMPATAVVAAATRPWANSRNVGIANGGLLGDRGRHQRPEADDVARR